MKEQEFHKYVEDEFRFLPGSYGFAQTSSEPDRVRYMSKDVMVEVNYSGRGEVDVILDENPPSHRFQFRLFLKAFYPVIEENLGYGIANNADEVRFELNRMAEALQKYGKQLLEHDLQVFEKMKSFKW